MIVTVIGYTPGAGYTKAATALPSPRPLPDGSDTIEHDGFPVCPTLDVAVQVSAGETTTPPSRISFPQSTVTV